METHKVRCCDCGATFTEVYPDGLYGGESYSDPADPKPCDCDSQYDILDADAAPVVRPTVDIDVMLRHYILAALWSSNDESNESGGDPMDDNYGPEDIDEETVATMRAECEAFVASVSDADLAAYAASAPGWEGDGFEAQLGHDFWLTRNGHGVGFWDRDWLEDAVGERLTELADAAGGRDLYVGDDGRIYQ